MKRKRKNWFTMVEVIVVLFIIATALIAIISGLSKTTRYISEMRQRTIALNLAKEGIEAVYNIRNTNWRKRSANKDACWLKANPLVDEGNDGCENDQRFAPGSRYAINTNWSKYFSLKDITWSGSHSTRMQHTANLVRDSQYLKKQINKIEKDTSSNPNDAHRNYFVHFVNGEWIDHQSFSKLTNEEQKKEIKSLGHYRRFISWWGLYSKIWEKDLSFCQNGLQDCGNSTPKELRFCSTVIYTRPHQGIVNICSIMTNFFE